MAIRSLCEADYGYKKASLQPQVFETCQWNEITKKHKDLAKLEKNGNAEIKQPKGSKKTSAKNLEEIFIPATNLSTDISSLFGAWKNTKINSADIRNGSRRKEQLQW